LNLSGDVLVSNFAFKFNLYRYTPALLQNIRGSLSAFRAELGALEKHSDGKTPANAKDVAECVAATRAVERR
jgi:hypothetical protein